MEALSLPESSSVAGLPVGEGGGGTELSNRVIRVVPIQSCGSTNDSVVRPLTQYPRRVDDRAEF
ncbi:hypothetical protein MTR_2g070160 [Medicago truncatula]|uniref:Uncharacterized protein n=1 Tax=Medicago truncatula TaxID=3880 RepID=A0A072V8R3_MEDTR|nr:hypothetical protein MTR_2g070160 [Medicago truncatula]